jgi:hypothetical protein
MATDYTYSKPGTVSPELGGLKEAIQKSSMTDKAFEYARWKEGWQSGGICGQPDPSKSEVIVTMTNTLSSGDEAILKDLVLDLPDATVGEPNLGPTSLVFGGSSSTIADRYLQIEQVYCNQAGPVLPVPMRLVAISACVDGRLPTDHTYRIHKNNEKSILASLQMTESSHKGIVACSIDLKAGDFMQVSLIGKAAAPVCVLWLEVI